MFGRKGCLVGCGVALGLVLLYPLYLLAQIVIPLVLGFLFPWEPPRAEEAPDEAVLRVMVPEDATYNLRWSKGASTEDVGEKVDPAPWGLYVLQVLQTVFSAAPPKTGGFLGTI